MIPLPKEMKKIFAILLTFLIAWPLMLKVYVFSAWQINQDFIAQTSCENRNDPSSSCAGSCQLVKQLEATDNQEKPFAPPVGIEKVELSTYTTTNTTQVSRGNDSKDTIKYFNTNDELLKSEIAFSFFHPPEPLV